MANNLRSHIATKSVKEPKSKKESLFMYFLGCCVQKNDDDNLENVLKQTNLYV